MSEKEYYNSLIILPKLHNELWIKIIENLDCVSILSLKLTSKYLNKLINRGDDLYMKRKLRGFPRPEGHCFAHNLSKIKLNFEGEDEIFESGDDNLINAFLKKATTKLSKLKLNVVRGDLICFKGIDCYRNDGVCIFDGQKIIQLNYDYDDYGCLPPNFKVINDNIPITYWYDIDGYKLGERSSKTRGIAHNSIIWFETSVQVKQQLLDNIVFGEKNPYTTFMYNDKKFIMEYATCDEDLDELDTLESLDLDAKRKILTDKLRKYLSGNGLLFLDYDAGFCEDLEFTGDNVMYISSVYGYYDKNDKEDKFKEDDYDEIKTVLSNGNEIIKYKRDGIETIETIYPNGRKQVVTIDTHGNKTTLYGRNK